MNILDFNLRHLGQDIKILRGGREAVNAAIRAKAHWGADWLENYLEDVGVAVDDGEDEDA